MSEKYIRKDYIYCGIINHGYVGYLGWNGASVISGSSPEHLISLSPNMQACKG